MSRSAALAAALAGALGACLTGTANRPVRAAPGPTADGRAAALELVLWDGGKLARWEVRVEVDDTPVNERWDEALARLFTFADGDGNGSLDQKEAGRLPSAFGLRQVLWGGFVTGPGAGPPWAELDRDGDSKVSQTELVDYYRRSGLGGVLVGAGKPLSTTALTGALLQQLDTDGNGTVDEKEWLAAADRLAELDQNEDELVTPGELVPRTIYPGATGANLLTAPAAKAVPSAVTDSVPLIVLPLSPADVHWATALVDRFDTNGDGLLAPDEAALSPEAIGALDANKDGKLSPGELAKWRGLPADARWLIRLGARKGGGAELEYGSPAANALPLRGERLDVSFGALRFGFRVDEGRLPRQWEEGRKRIAAQFADADPGRKGFVDPAGAAGQNLAEIRAAVHAGDRNGDGKLDEKEFAAWLDVRDRFVKSHVLLTVMDHGPGLFELLDANHDGALSVRELRGAWNRLRNAGCVRDGRFDGTRVPRQFCLTVSAGLPASPLGRATPAGPAWFRAMDRNGDGDVSRKEFTGPPDAFDKLDLDKDGLLSAEEALKAGGKK